MRAVYKNLIYPNYTLQLHVNCDGTVEYSVNNGQLYSLRIEISKTAGGYFVHPIGINTRPFLGTKAACVCYVVEYIKSIVRI